MGEEKNINSLSKMSSSEMVPISIYGCREKPGNFLNTYSCKENKCKNLIGPIETLQVPRSYADNGKTLIRYVSKYSKNGSIVETLNCNNI